ncbi:MAG: multiple promoter invertase [Bacilli bacterium]|nr:multiple promoter invertase [Bacilli bacterium]
MERVAIYLRKSRADEEAEKRGEGETLSKHRSALLKHAKLHSLNIIEIYNEIQSGESLIHRPQMLELLKQVESKEYDAVLVMDLDRLGRGNMQEQGLILETFRTSNTKIITTRKVYDLNNEFDDEYSEFEVFMARKELKIITRRLQGGRVRSVEEGNYIGTRAPYGYQIHKTDHERILVPNPEQAPVVKMIFEWYTQEDPHQRKGSNKIANELNRLGYKTYTEKPWEASTVLFIIKNAVYTGRLQWKKKESKKSKEVDKVRVTRTRERSEWIDVKGKHEPLIAEDLYNKAQSILKTKYHVPYQLENGITNPLAGLIKCELCGSSMVLRPYVSQPSHIKCYNQFCQNKSSQFIYVEQKLLTSLNEWLINYKAEWTNRKKPTTSSNSLGIRELAVKNLEKELMELEIQKGRLHDFLERGTYTEEVYLDRSQNLADRINENQSALKHAQSELVQEIQRETAQKDIIPKIESVLKLYHRTKDPAKKNSLLKSILQHAVYRKEKIQRNDSFTLTLLPKLPHSSVVQINPKG